MIYKSIAIDGPSGAGKSTLARRVASDMRFLYVDTGAIYRTVGVAAFRANIGSKDMENVYKMLPSLSIHMAYDESGVQRMYLNGEDVTDAIRMPEISMYASDVSAMPKVREFLMNMQRDMAKTNDVIMDGRDIGTVVLPNAQLKIFLTASPEIRAQRRWLELREKGRDCTYEEVLADIVTRDTNDSTRAIAPLKQSEDAVYLDNSDLNFEQAVAEIIKLIKGKFDI